MRPDIVSEASVSTRINQWWEGIPLVTSAVVIVCASIYLVCLLVGYDSFVEICFLPSAIVSQFQGFSGILFSMIVMETSLSGLQSRSVFGLFNVPTKWYPWILLVVFQLLMTNVSLLGHLCGILSGFAYTYGLLNFLIPGTSFFSRIENASWLSTCVRRPKFIVSTGGSPSGYVPTYSSSNPTSSGVTTDLWSHVSSWMPQRNTSAQSAEDTRFPGAGRTLGSNTTRNGTAPGITSDSNLQARLLDNTSSEDTRAANTGGGREPAVNSPTGPALPARQQDSVVSSEGIHKLVAMGFEKTQVEVALAAADGDLDVAVEILMTQQG